MKVVKNIVTVPIIIVLCLLKCLIDLIIKAECWVAGVGFLLLAILTILAVVKQQWLQIGIFAGLASLGIIILILSANILVWIERGLERLK
ncbi:MAG: hypothetical protein GXX92_01760 [Clostridiales bacterium]|nr:hypothetical protein [Clostridiales bacterium]